MYHHLWSTVPNKESIESHIKGSWWVWKINRADDCWTASLLCGLMYLPFGVQNEIVNKYFLNIYICAPTYKLRRKEKNNKFWINTSLWELVVNETATVRSGPNWSISLIGIGLLKLPYKHPGVEETHSFSEATTSSWMYTSSKRGRDIRHLVARIYESSIAITLYSLQGLYFFFSIQYTTRNKATVRLMFDKKNTWIFHFQQ